MKEHSLDAINKITSREKHELAKLAYYCIAFEKYGAHYGNNFIFQKGRLSRAFISAHSGKFNKSEINEKRYAPFHQLALAFIILPLINPIMLMSNSV